MARLYPNRGSHGHTGNSHLNQPNPQLKSVPIRVHPRNPRLIAFVFVLLALLPLRVFAQDATAIGTASLTAPDAPITVGDIVELTLEVRHPAGTVAIVPPLPEQWGDLEVRSQAPVTVDQEGDTLISRQIIAATLFAPGDFVTPPLTVALTDGGGNAADVIAQPLSLTVASVLTDADTEPRDIKGQAEIAGVVPTTTVVAVVGALALVALLLWWFSRRKSIGALLSRTPLQRVYDELDAIASQDYPAREEYKQLYLAVSDVVRRFAQRQLGMPLQERTTAEMRYLMRQARIQPDVAKQLINLFNECDLVKFSQVTPTPESAADLFAEARSVVALLANGAHAEPQAAAVEQQAHG